MTDNRVEHLCVRQIGHPGEFIEDRLARLDQERTQVHQVSNVGSAVPSARDDQATVAVANQNLEAPRDR
jgi:hypothetical protein